MLALIAPSLVHLLFLSLFTRILMLFFSAVQIQPFPIQYIGLGQQLLFSRLSLQDVLKA
jgi:hypothetical protein